MGIERNDYVSHVGPSRQSCFNETYAAGYNGNGNERQYIYHRSRVSAVITDNILMKSDLKYDRFARAGNAGGMKRGGRGLGTSWRV